MIPQQVMVACDFFVVVTATFRRLYVFVKAPHPQSSSSGSLATTI
jgi:hypothetical protein